MKTLLKVIILAVIIGGGIGYYMYNKAPAKLAKVKADYALQAQELFTNFSDDESTANEKYLDKIIQVKGNIREISADEEGKPKIILETEDPMGGISCSMEGKSAAIDKLEKGQEVTIKGICTGILMDVVLNRCVLVKN